MKLERLKKNPVVIFVLSGLVAIVLFNLVVVAVVAQRKAADAKPEPSPSPSPTPSLAPSPVPTPQTNTSPKPSPKVSPTPKASATPKPSASPTPKPSPSPSPAVKSEVRIVKPDHKQSLDATSVEIEITVLGSKSVKRIEVVINNEIKKTVDNQRTVKETFNLPAGAYDLKGRAVLDDNEVIESGILEFGTGGKAWDYVEPSPTPTPSPEPSPTP